MKINFSSGLVLALFFVCAYVNAQTGFEKRINCGGPALTYSGNNYDADDSPTNSLYSNGELVGNFTSVNLPSLYQTIRYTKNTNRELFYDIAVPSAGTYDVILQFAEPYWGVSSGGSGNGVRVFDVFVEGTELANDLDVVQTVGPHAVYTINHQVTMSSGDLVINIEMDAEPGKNDPIINAIEVLEVDNTTCPDQLTNQSTSITLSPGQLEVGASTATGVSVGNSCGLRVQTNSGNAWGRYNIPINIANNALISGDQIEISFDITNQTGNFLYQVAVDNSNGNIIDSSSSLPITGRTITVPSGATTLNIWFFTNHSQWTTSGSIDISNLSVAKVGGGGNDQQPPTISNFTATALDSDSVQFLWTSSDSDSGIASQSISYSGNTVNLSEIAQTHTLDGLDPDTAYNFTLSVTDVAGNSATASDSATTTSTGGGNPPSGDSPWTLANSVVSVGTTTDGTKVGIGTANIPNDYRLAVDGNIIAEEIRVELSDTNGAWPDYVFSKEYDLPSLEEIQKFISKKGHLPNIPSAKEVEANGIELGEMNRLLLEKIEELTLYILQQQKEIDLLKKKK